MADIAPASPASAPAASPAAPTSGNAPATSPVAPTPLAAPAETTTEKKARLLKLKVDGVEEEMDVNSMPDEKLAVELQMARAARKRMQEAADTRKQFTEILEYIKRDPFAALKDPVFGGIDLDSLSEQRLGQRYREETLPEADRKALQLERELEQYKQKEQSWKQQQEMAAQAEVDRRVHAEIDRDFKSALNDFGLPQTRETLYMMAEIASTSLGHGVELSPKQLASEVKERLGGIHKHVTSGLKGDALVAYLGPDVVREILRTAVAKKRAGSPGAVTPAPTNIDMGDRPKRQMQDPREFRKYLRA